MNDKDIESHIRTYHSNPYIHGKGGKKEIRHGKALTLEEAQEQIEELKSQLAEKDKRIEELETAALVGHHEDCLYFRQCRPVDLPVFCSCAGTLTAQIKALQTRIDEANAQITELTGDLVTAAHDGAEAYKKVFKRTLAELVVKRKECMALRTSISAAKGWLAFNLDDHTANMIIKILTATPKKGSEK